MRKANLFELVVQRTQEARQERPNPWSRSRSTPHPMPSSTRASSSTAALWWPALPPHGRPPTSTARAQQALFFGIGSETVQYEELRTSGDAAARGVSQLTMSSKSSMQNYSSTRKGQHEWRKQLTMEP
ncbi:hypothetical protein EJB05_22825 [Eragrostis curvula]|uniref:Uncharacterized protein n=1 Tax=Eragrostis curvula TaxID=38414 RepID=A0A5J9V5D2_9POAL|nr:hypothetical protein EJB05_22825 [Eragrostis curvula]